MSDFDFKRKELYLNKLGLDLYQGLARKFGVQLIPPLGHIAAGNRMSPSN